MAIAFEATGNSGIITSASSASWSHNVSSTDDTVIAVCVGAQDVTAGDRDVSSVTFNSDALTEEREDNGSSGDTADYRVSSWYRVAPDTGNNTVSVTWGGTIERGAAGSVSLTGVDQSSPVDSSNGGFTNDNATHTVSVTVINENSWVIDGGLGRAPSPSNTNSVGSGQTERWNIGGGTTNRGMGSTEGPVSSGSVAMSWSQSGSFTENTDWGTALIAFQPTVTPQPSVFQTFSGNPHRLRVYDY